MTLRLAIALAITAALCAWAWTYVPERINEMTDEEIDRILSTPVPGGAQARDCFLPHDSERGRENVRNVVRCMMAVVQERCAFAAWAAGMDYHNKTLGMPADARDVGSAAADAIRNISICTSGEADVGEVRGANWRQQ